MICMHKGAPILRSALTGGLRLELTYRDPFAKERADELCQPRPTTTHRKACN